MPHLHGVVALRNAVEQDSIMGKISIENATHSLE